MKKLITICAAALAIAVIAADTDCGALITTGNIADSAKVENLTGANAGKATITINDNSGTAKSVTVYNSSTMDTALAGKASTGDLATAEANAQAAADAAYANATNNAAQTYNALWAAIPSWAKAASKPSYNFSEIGSKPTTIAGYGITDAKIANGTITLGSNSITPLTSYTETDPVWTAAKVNYSTTAQMNSAITAATNGLAKASALSGYVPTSRKVAGMSLTGDITLKSLSIVGASTTTYNGSAAASVNQSTLTEAAKTSGGTSGKTLTLAVASTSRSLGEYYISIGSDGKPHLMLRQ